jgi:hypothetical protein
MTKIFKAESIQDFIARGGVIKRIPYSKNEKKSDVVRKTDTGPAIILSYAEADLFYGESKPSKAKAAIKSAPTIDISSLPEALRIKYINKLKADQDEK